MSAFKTDLKMALLGKLSTESAEVDQGTYETGEITPEVIQETREERSELREVLDQVEASSDAKDAESSQVVCGALAEVAIAAPDVPPAAGETFVQTANMNIQTASRVLDVNVPELATDATGAVSDVSMEGLGEWFGDALKAFGGVAAKAGGRIALSFVRLNESTKGLHNRTSRIRNKLGGRKGSGGKQLRLGNGTLRLLVDGHQITDDPIASLRATASTSLALFGLVGDYHKRVDGVVKEFMINAISQKDIPNDVFAGVRTDDLFKALDKIIADQPQQLMGNVRYARNADRHGRLLAFGLERVGGDPVEIARHSKQPSSLTDDEIKTMCGELDTIIQEAAKVLERQTEATRVSYASVQTTIQKLTKIYDDANGDEDGLFDAEINVADLLRLETSLVSEIGQVCDRLARVQADFLERIDAVLTLVEESIFQD